VFPLGADPGGVIRARTGCPVAGCTAAAGTESLLKRCCALSADLTLASAQPPQTCRPASNHGGVSSGALVCSAGCCLAVALGHVCSLPDFAPPAAISPTPDRRGSEPPRGSPAVFL